MKLNIRKRLADLLDRVLGEDEEEAVTSGLDAKDELDVKVRPLHQQTPDFRISVYWDPENEEFRAFLFTRHLRDPIINGIEGETPGEAFAYGGALLDAYLARRGFKREIRLNLRPKDTT